MKHEQPKIGDGYYHVQISGSGAGKVCLFFYTNYEIDKPMVKIGNCFRTKKDAEAMKVKLLKVLKRG